MTFSLPRWQRRLPRLRLGPLPATSLLVALLIALPASQLGRYPRATAIGLERLSGVATLIQSFAADPSRPVPLLWRQRLGEVPATRLWQQHRGGWWQFWGREEAGGAYLALPAVLFGPRAEALLPPHALRIDDLVLIAPDPLSRQLLQQQLVSPGRPPRGLEARCVALLRTSSAVAWSKVALAQLSGDLAPLLQRFQQGCLELGSEAGRLTWLGEASAVAGAPAPAPSSGLLPPERIGVDPLPPPLLLEVRGQRLDLLLDALLSNQLIRQPLEERYGLSPTLLGRLADLPFQLRLRSQPGGPFLASLELQLTVGPQRADWIGWLVPLREALEAQGLQERPPAAPSAALPATLPSSRWARSDGTVVGGWTWVTTAGGGPAELLFVLGEMSEAPAAAVPSGRAPRSGSREGLPPGAELRLRAHPAELEARGLLPPELPSAVRRARSLELLAAPLPTTGTGAAAEAGPGRRSPLSRLWGWLELEGDSGARGG